MGSTFKPGSVARVIKDYEAAYPDPFFIRAGEELQVGKRDTQWPAYVWCTNREGEGRWVPESYLDRTGDIAIARYDYSAVELTVATGEELVLEKEAGDWYWATNQAGQSGWVPAEHVDTAHPQEDNMTQTIRWGIIGTGNIAKQFARGLAVLPDAELIAVGSRTQASADTFGNMFDVPHRHAHYEELAHDPDVDAVYVATPHALHRENSLMCLQAGKAVLCEKPFTINAAQAEEVIGLAREKGLFLMEAMWTRFLPGMVTLRELLAANVIGEVRMLTADFGFRTQFNPESRLLNPELGGGALLDVGVYTVSLASMILGSPARITSMAHLGKTGVDEQAAMIFGYEEGQLALLSTAIRTTTPQEAILMGTDGRIRLHYRWWVPTTLTLSASGQDDELIEIPYTGNGYNYEAAEVAQCLRSGKLESDIMPLDETLSIMQTMDALRAQWGLKYPMEQ